jgi:hypothetical protein
VRALLSAFLGIAVFCQPVFAWPLSDLELQRKARRKKESWFSHIRPRTGRHTAPRRGDCRVDSWFLRGHLAPGLCDRRAGGKLFIFSLRRWREVVDQHCFEPGCGDDLLRLVRLYTSPAFPRRHTVNVVESLWIGFAFSMFAHRQNVSQAVQSFPDVGTERERYEKF